MILYHAADLLWATKIKKEGESAGIPCRPVRSVEMLEARLADSDVRAVIVDLDAPDVALALIAALRTGKLPRPDIPVMAFGPHIAVDLFEQARAAGADRVLARGAFDRQMARILTELEHGKPA